jgi:hypothetical protein
MEMPGKVVGMTSSEPSSSGGMNSEPSRSAIATVPTINAAAAARTYQRPRTAARISGRYTALSARLPAS